MSNSGKAGIFIIDSEEHELLNPFSSYWMFFVTLLVMSIIKTIAIVRYHKHESETIRVSLILVLLDGIIFLSCPKWKSMPSEIGFVIYFLQLAWDHFLAGQGQSFFTGFITDRTPPGPVFLSVFFLGLILYMKVYAWPFRVILII